MSSILKALKKVESEKLAQKGPGNSISSDILKAGPTVRRRGRRRLPLMVVLLLMTVSVGAYLYQDGIPKLPQAAKNADQTLAKTREKSLESPTPAMSKVEPAKPAPREKEPAKEPAKAVATVNVPAEEAVAVKAPAKAAAVEKEPEKTAEKIKTVSEAAAKTAQSSELSAKAAREATEAARDSVVALKKTAQTLQETAKVLKDKAKVLPAAQPAVAKKEDLAIKKVRFSSASRAAQTMTSSKNASQVSTKPKAAASGSTSSRWTLGMAKGGETAMPELQVSEIHYRRDVKERLAVVNDLPVMEGVMIEGVKVDRIFRDRIRFLVDGKYHEVRLR